MPGLVTFLLQQGAIPRRDLDTAQAALVQAKAAYDIANRIASGTVLVAILATVLAGISEPSPALM